MRILYLAEQDQSLVPGRGLDGSFLPGWAGRGTTASGGTSCSGSSSHQRHVFADRSELPRDGRVKTQTT
ncbi:hypothetical protein E2C01_091083 [Portunus trituberculatus]|uniref:Uncharacterized protein n=1 Tax=Portunus trituberculatus TaxID=210409 RepID=A0A5B7JU42_PORTR|nr:hypothetical protein [Portunus trituberculatus]